LTSTGRRSSIISIENLSDLHHSVERPDFDVRKLGVGLVHIGLGAFHRSHQAVFTDDAIASAGGRWGIIGVSLRGSSTSQLINRQEGLYTVETLGDERRYRVIGAVRGALSAITEPQTVLDTIASSSVHVVTITVTEKGYSLKDNELDLLDPKIVADISSLNYPSTTIGWIVRGLQARWLSGAGPLTILCCDNLLNNGQVLRSAVLSFAALVDRNLTSWIVDNISFPGSMVDRITPASDDGLVSRVADNIGYQDDACVQCEPFSQWVIEDQFSGPRPAWDRVGVEFVDNISLFQQLKLHVLNTANSCLAYLGLIRGYQYAHEAMGDAQIAEFVDALILVEMAAAFPNLPIDQYWPQVRGRLLNPHVRHRLTQIGEDGSAKLSQRIYEPLLENLRLGKPYRKMAILMKTWILVSGMGLVVDPHSKELIDIFNFSMNKKEILYSNSIIPLKFRSDILFQSIFADNTLEFH